MTVPLKEISTFRIFQRFSFQQLPHPKSSQTGDLLLAKGLMGIFIKLSGFLGISSKNLYIKP